MHLSIVCCACGEVKWPNLRGNVTNYGITFTVSYGILYALVVHVLSVFQLIANNNGFQLVKRAAQLTAIK